MWLFGAFYLELLNLVRPRLDSFRSKLNQLNRTISFSTRDHGTIRLPVAKHQHTGISSTQHVMALLRPMDMPANQGVATMPTDKIDHSHT